MARGLTVTSRRRLFGTGVAAAAALVFGWGVYLHASSLNQHNFFDGWVLLACMLLLAGYNVRKKVPMLPLGRAVTWKQVHVYAGFFTVAAFLIHTEFSLPSGALDWALWGLFVLVALSGILGLYLTVTVPPKLEQGPEQILLERIPGFRAQLAKETEQLAMRSVADETSLTISNFYADRLHDYMSGHRDLLAHLRGSQRVLHRIRGEIAKLRRYLDKSGSEILDEIEACVVAKHNLDSQYAHRMALRVWLFVHIPATYSLVLLLFVHVAVVYAFSSGRP